MAEAEDRLDFCRQALGELGTRSTIVSLDPPDGSQEAFYCNLFFEGTRDQVLRMAHWNFAGISDVLTLWKAAPGTPENPEPGGSWSNRDPAPGWLYSYVHPGGRILQIRRVRGQELPNMGADIVPLYGGVNLGSTIRGFAQFEVGFDIYDKAGNRLGFTQTIGTTTLDPPVTIVNPGFGYRAGDYIVASQFGANCGFLPIIQPLQVDTSGRILLAEVTNGGTFVSHNTGTLTQVSTNGSGSGFTFNARFIDHPPSMQVILTNVQNALMDVTAETPVARYDPLFADAFMLAFEAKLALALLGDRAIYAAKLQEANTAIIQARTRDGNEGLTIYEHVPDWLRVRGVTGVTPGSSYYPDYGPLFAV